jgi:Domain of unknown function (DUF1877)
LSARLENRAMSMIGYVLGLTPAQIGAMRAKPSLVNKVTRVVQETLHQAHLASMLGSMSPEQRQQYETAMAPLQTSPLMEEARASNQEARKQTMAIGPFERALSLEKSWHILHYLFTGHSGVASAPGDYLLTGESLGEDVGYGPARLHEPAAARAFSAFLQALDEVRLHSRINLAEMDRLHVYGTPRVAGAIADPETGLREEIGFYFPRLRDYVGAMSSKGSGLLIWLS